jgi:anti-sigma factor RsiW
VTVEFQCDDTLLQMYVEGLLGPVERSILAEHVKACPRCRAQVGTYKGLLWDLEHPDVDPDPDSAGVPLELDALSDRLMAAWTEAQAPKTWQKASLAWTQTVPAVDLALGAAGRVGRSLPRLGVAGLSSLSRLLRRGGGGR